MEIKEDKYYSYNVVLAKTVGKDMKGDKIEEHLSYEELQKFLGKISGFPFGYCGHIGETMFAYKKEIMDNIVIEQVKHFTKTVAKKVAINHFN